MVASAACALMGFGCGDDGTDAPPDATNNPTNNEPAPPQGVRVFYAPSSPETIKAVFKSDDEAVEAVELSPVVAYTPSAYQPLEPGIYRAILVDAQGAPTGVTVESISVEATSMTTVFVGEGPGGDTRKQIFSDLASVPSENHAQLRFVYEAMGAPVDIYSLVDGLRIGTSLGQGELIPHTEYAAGTYSFEVRAEGGSEVLLAINEVPLPPGQVVTVFVYGDSAATLGSVVAVDRTF